MTDEVSSIGVRLTLDATGFVEGADAAAGAAGKAMTAITDLQAAKAGSGAGQMKAGGGATTASGLPAAQNLTGVNVSLTINADSLSKLRGDIQRGLGTISVNVTPNIVNAQGQGIQAGRASGLVGSGRQAGQPIGSLVVQGLSSQRSAMFDEPLGLAQSRILNTSRSHGMDLLGKMPTRAHGGPVQQNRPTIVGERRAEVFVPKTSGHIEPDARSYFRQAERTRQIEMELAVLEARQQDQHNRQIARVRGGGVRGRQLYGGKYGAARPGTVKGWFAHQDETWGYDVGEPGMAYHGTDHLPEIRGEFPPGWSRPGVKPTEGPSYWSRIPLRHGYGPALLKTPEDGRFRQSGMYPVTDERIPRSRLQYWGDDNDWHRFRKGRARVRGGGVRGYGGKYGSSRPASSRALFDYQEQAWGGAFDTDRGYAYHVTHSLPFVRRGGMHGAGVRPRSSRFKDNHAYGESPFENASYWTTGGNPLYMYHDEAAVLRTRLDSRFAEPDRAGSTTTRSTIPRRDLQYWGEDNDWHKFRRGRARMAGGPVEGQFVRDWRKEKGWRDAERTEMVSISTLLPLREIDRESHPRFAHDFGYLDELTEKIRTEGFDARQPVILDYDPFNHTAMLGDGNHRLAVAQRLGMTHVPTRMQIQQTPPRWKSKGRKLPGTSSLFPDENGYIPASLPPSWAGFREGGGPVWKKLLSQGVIETRNMGRRAQRSYQKRYQGFDEHGLLGYVKHDVGGGAIFDQGPGSKAFDMLVQSAGNEGDTTWNQFEAETDYDFGRKSGHNTSFASRANLYEKLGSLMPIEPLMSISGKLRKLFEASPDDRWEDRDVEAAFPRTMGDRIRQAEDLVNMTRDTLGSIDRKTAMKILDRDYKSSGRREHVGSWWDIGEGLEALPKRSAFPMGTRPWGLPFHEATGGPKDLDLLPGQFTTGVNPKLGDVHGDVTGGTYPGKNFGLDKLAKSDFLDPTQFTEAGYRTIHGLMKGRNNASGGRVKHAGAGSLAFKSLMAQGPGGGGTYPVDPSIRVPKTGHAVGISEYLSGAQSYHVSADDPRSFLEAFRAQRKAGAPYVGTWWDPDTNLIDVDPSTVIPRKREADMVLRGGHEKAAFDLRVGQTDPEHATWYASDKRLRASADRLKEIIYGKRQDGGWVVPEGHNRGLNRLPPNARDLEANVALVARQIRKPDAAMWRDWYTIAHAQASGDLADFNFPGEHLSGVAAYAAASPGMSWPANRAALRSLMHHGMPGGVMGSTREDVPGYSPVGFGVPHGYGFLDEAYEHLLEERFTAGPKGAKREPFFSNLSGLDPNALTLDSRMSQVLFRSAEHTDHSGAPISKNPFGESLRRTDALRGLMRTALDNQLKVWGPKLGIKNLSEFQAALWSQHGGADLGTDWERTKSGIAIPRHPGLVVPFHRADGGYVDRLMGDWSPWMGYQMAQEAQAKRKDAPHASDGIFADSYKEARLLHKYTPPKFKLAFPGGQKYPGQMLSAIDQIRGIPDREHALTFNPTGGLLGEAIGGATSVDPTHITGRPWWIGNRGVTGANRYSADLDLAMSEDGNHLQYNPITRLNLSGATNVHQHPDMGELGREIWRPSSPDITGMLTGRERESWVVTPHHTTIMRLGQDNSGMQPLLPSPGHSISSRIINEMGFDPGMDEDEMFTALNSRRVNLDARFWTETMDEMARKYKFEWEHYIHPRPAPARQLRMFGGREGGGDGRGNGLYIVNEIGKELFVPNRLSHLIPPRVMEQIPKAASGAFVINQPANSLFSPPEDGIIVPHRLMDQVPHAADGKWNVREPSGRFRSRDSLPVFDINRETGPLPTMGRGLDRPTYIRIAEEAAAAAARATAAGSASGPAPRWARPAGGGTTYAVPTATVATPGAAGAGAASAGGGIDDEILPDRAEHFRASQAGLPSGSIFAARTPKSQMGSMFADIFGDRQKSLTQLAAQREASRAVERSERSIGRNAGGARAGADAIATYQEALDKVATATGPAKQAAIDHAEALGKANPELVKHVALQEHEAKVMAAGTPGKMAAARNFASILAGVQVYSMAMQGASFVMGAVVPVIEKQIDALTGWRSTFTAVTSSMAEQTTQAHGNVVAVIAQSAATAGLSAGAYDYVKASLETTALVKSGAKAEEETQRLIRASIGSKGQGATPQGLYGGYGGVMGTSLFGSDMGGGKGFMENVQGLFSNTSKPNVGASLDLGVQYLTNKDFRNMVTSIEKETSTPVLGAITDALGGAGDVLRGLPGPVQLPFLGASLAAGAFGKDASINPVINGAYNPAEAMKAGNVVAFQANKVGLEDLTKAAERGAGVTANAAKVSWRYAKTLEEETAARNTALIAGDTYGATLASENHIIMAINDEVAKSTEEYRKAATQTAVGKTIVAPEIWAQNNLRQLSGAQQAAQMQSERQRDVTIPMELWKSTLLNPLIPPSSQFYPGAGSGGQAEAQADYDKLVTLSAAGYQAALADVKKYASTTGEMVPAPKAVTIPTASSWTPAPSTRSGPPDDRPRRPTTSVPPASSIPTPSAGKGLIESAIDAFKWVMATPVNGKTREENAAAVTPTVTPSVPRANEGNIAARISPSGAVPLRPTMVATPSTDVADFEAASASATKLSGEIANLTKGMMEASRAASVASWANQIRIANRSLGDALGLLGKIGGTRLGHLQREQWLNSRASQHLGLQLQQRQITTQLALAQFQAPGETGEERYFKQKEAIATAGISQQQLNFSFKDFTLSGQIWKITADRAATDAQRAITVMQLARDAETTAINSQIQIANKSRLLAQEVATIDRILGKAQGNFSSQLSAATSGISDFSGSLKEGLKEVWKALGYTVTESKNGTVKVTGRSNAGSTDGAGTYGAGSTYHPPTTAPKPEATGILGMTAGATDITVGEAGTETVAILRNPRTSSLAPSSGGGGAPVINISISGPVVRSEQDIDALATAVAAKVERSLSRKGQMFGLRGSSV